MKKYSCIIFDMDGTLTQTNRLIFEAFNYVAEKHIKKKLSEEEIIALFGPPEDECLIAVVGPERIEAAIADYYRFYHDHHNELAQLHPGIIGILNYLKQRGVKIALFTGKGRSSTDITLEQFGINEYFSVTVTGSDVAEFKPSGDGIKKILARMSLSADDVLMVGDAVSDVQAAREAGVDIAAVLWDSYGKEEVMKLHTDFLFHDVEEFSIWLYSLYE
jgi:pyrophosphatase PpaX